MEDNKRDGEGLVERPLPLFEQLRVLLGYRTGSDLRRGIEQRG